jgi:hypothetical protein
VSLLNINKGRTFEPLPGLIHRQPFTARRSGHNVTDDIDPNEGPQPQVTVQFSQAQLAEILRAPAKRGKFNNLPIITAGALAATLMLPQSWRRAYFKIINQAASVGNLFVQYGSAPTNVPAWITLPPGGFDEPWTCPVDDVYVASNGAVNAIIVYVMDEPLNRAKKTMSQAPYVES